VRLNTILQADAAWLEGEEMLLLTVPDKCGPAPVFDAPTGPAFQQSMGRVSPERTLQDLPKNAQATALLEHRVAAAPPPHRSHAAPTLRTARVADGGPRALGEQLTAPVAPTPHLRQIKRELMPGSNCRWAATAMAPSRCRRSACTRHWSATVATCAERRFPSSPTAIRRASRWVTCGTR